jgi:hypothetical protein
MKARVVLAVGFFSIVVASCGSSSPPSGSARPPGSAGIVPSDLRDVERDAEGLVATTFGQYGTRVPDWTRAASLLSLLKQVWRRGEASHPGIPEPASKAIDDALTTLDAAIAAGSQEDAAYASNAIGLAVPDGFAYFHPDAPLGIVRMKAYFRRVRLDGHFGKFAQAGRDVAHSTRTGRMRGLRSMRPSRPATGLEAPRRSPAISNKRPSFALASRSCVRATAASLRQMAACSWVPLARASPA